MYWTQGLSLSLRGPQTSGSWSFFRFTDTLSIFTDIDRQLYFYLLLSTFYNMPEPKFWGVYALTPFVSNKKKAISLLKIELIWLFYIYQLQSVTFQSVQLSFVTPFYLETILIGQSPF